MDKQPNPFTSPVPVELNDQTTQMVEVIMYRVLDSCTLASATTIDTYTCVFNSWHWILVDELLTFKSDTRFMQAKVLNVATNTITLDTPFDFAFPITSIVVRGRTSMNEDGSITPIVYRTSPSGLNVKMDITNIVIHMEDNSSMDSNKFWWLPALTRGIVLRKKDGIYYNIMNIKSNWELQHHCQVVDYDDRSSWTGVYWLRAIKTFWWQSNQWVVLRLDGSTNDELQIIVQDDLTWLDEIHCICIWHIVD